MKRRALVLLFLLLCSGCDGTELITPTTPTPSPTSAPVELVFALPRTSGSVHPILSRDRVNLSLTGLLWEGLFALDRSFAPQPVLCERYTTEGLVWTFFLRQGVTFSDGTPLSASDVIYSLNLARGETSRFSTRLAGITNVQEKEGAVVITLAQPNGGLPALLDVPIVRGASEQPVGTGSYVQMGTGEEATLLARSDWWQGNGLPITSIPLHTLPEADDLISAFDTGDVTMVTADLTGTSSVGYGGNYETWDYPTTGMIYLGFQCRTKSPCQDAALRRALSHGLDRNTVASALYAMHAQASALPVSPASELYDPQLAAELEYSPQIMATLLAEAGYTKQENGLLAKGRTVLTLDLLVNTDNSFRLSVAEYLAAELKRAGVSINLRRLSWGEYEKALEKGDFDLYIGETMLTADFDLSPLLLANGGLNYSGYSSQETIGLLSTVRVAEGAARKPAFADLFRQLGQDPPFATICFKNQSVLTQWGGVTGLSPTQQDPFYLIQQWKFKT